MEYLLVIILAFLLLVIITRPFTVLFHELGHAIPAMLMTRQGATVYVGSYGDKNQSLKLVLGGLEIWFRYNPFKWRGGLCIPKAEEISLHKVAIYTICGPLLSLAIAIVAFYVSLLNDLHGSIKLICAFALGSTVVDLFSNLIPHQIKAADGSILFSDGYHLLYLQRLKKFPAEYANAVESYQQKEYTKTGKLFEGFINKGLANEDVYRFASTSYIFTKNYEKAHSIQKEFESKYHITSDDYYNLGLTCLLLNLNDQKAHYFSKSLELNPDNAYSLNAIGYDLNTKGKFREAILLFDKAIEIQKEFAYAYNNRGHAKIETGQFDEGLRDIQQSLRLDNENSYVYRNLGIYYLKTGEHSAALDYFLQSKQIDKDTDLIDELIKKAKALI